MAKSLHVHRVIPNDTPTAGAIGFFEHDQLTDTLYWSPAYRKILGIDANVEGRLDTYLGMVDPRDRRRIQDAVRTAHSPESDGSFSVEHRLIRPDGEVIWLMLNAQTTFDGSATPARPIRTIGAVVDITHTKKLEQRLSSFAAATTAQLAAVLDAVPDAMVIADVDRNIRMCNQALQELFGYSADEIVGRHADCLYEKDADVKAISEAWEGWVAENEGEPTRVICRRKDGSTFAAMVVGKMSQAASVEGKFRVGLVRDISESELRESMLRQSQKLEALGQLTGGVAHDFNNLLTVIVSTNELLMEQLDVGSQAAELLAVSNEAAQRGADLTGQLLAFARQQPLMKRIVDVNALVMGMQELLRRTLEETIEIELDLETELEKTIVDPSQLHSVLLNLAINARDAMPGGGRLSISTQNITIDDESDVVGTEVSQGDCIRLSVRDTGTGMSNETQARVFEPFFTTKEHGRGTGLGLSMVHGFLTQSGGHVGLSSELGVGTEISLFLPRATAEAESAVVEPTATTTAEAEGRTILVVEDDPSVRKLTVARLKHLKFDTLEAGNVEEALEALDGNRTIQIVLTDVVMPGEKSGVDLLNEVQQEHPSVKVVLTSGYAPDVELPGSKTPWLQKPYSINVLSDTLGRLLRE